jgi:hypothetical protein
MNYKLKKINALLFVIFFLACTKEEPVIIEGVVINELMAFNFDYVADQNGEFDDWIELYNNSSKAINLKGYYLSDSKSNLTKWSLPDTLIGPNAYLIIWADGDTLQSGLHSNYKLSTDGESVLFLDPELHLIDRVKYDANIHQQSFARIPNGTGIFYWVDNPTFNNENLQNQ